MVDTAPFASLQPLDVAAYLRARGWSLADEDPRVAVWERTASIGPDDAGDPVEIQQPLHSDWRDYPRRVQHLVETVSEVEGRRVEAVLRDMSSSAWDTMRVRAVAADAEEGSLTVDDAARLLTCIERLMLAGACAAAGGHTAFEDAIRTGVSADLCEAVGLLEEPGSSLQRVEFQVSWALIRPAPPGPTPPASFARDALAVVKAAGRALRERLPVEDFELTGYVIDLARAGDVDAGNATIAATIDGTPRKVAVALRDEDWRLAHAALGRRQRVSCEGLLRKQRGGFMLDNVRNFVVEREE